MYKVEYTRSAVRRLNKLSGKLAANIRNKVEALAQDPYGKHNNATKLQGEEGYRLRVGDWRVFYEIDNNRIIVLVIDIRHRGGAYQ